MKKEKAEKTKMLKQKPFKHRSRYDSDEDINLRCGQCKFTCQSRTGLLNHMRMHQASITFTCSLCFEQFESNGELMAHRKRHYQEQHMFLCKPCQLAFSDHLDYLLHMVQHTNGKPYRCKECSKILNTKDGFKFHIQSHFDRSIKCEKCGKCYKSEYRYHIHLKTHVEAFTCGECGKSFKTASTLKYHMVSHTGVKMYQCVYCGKGFACHGQRQIHTRTHTDERPYECKVCQRRFHQISDLNTHKSTHEKVRQVFECQFCQKKFLQKASLVAHERIHTKTDLFACPQCDKEFTTLPNLRSHMIHMHTDVRLHKCDVCQISFKMKTDLQRHNRSIRHKNKVYGAMLRAKKIT